MIKKLWNKIVSWLFSAAGVEKEKPVVEKNKRGGKGD